MSGHDTVSIHVCICIPLHENVSMGCHFLSQSLCHHWALEEILENLQVLEQFLYKRSNSVHIIQFA